METKDKLPAEVSHILISEGEISARVREMGEELTRDYEGKDPLVICILKGAVCFFADVTRHMRCRMEMDFMALSSYRGGVKTSGIVRISKDVDVSLTGRHVLIAEDIMDSGLTLQHLTEVLQARKPASLKIACLLDKPSRRECDITPDYCGFVIPNEFVVGYGLDYDGAYRNLPYVAVLSPEVYGG